MLRTSAVVIFNLLQTRFQEAPWLDEVAGQDCLPSLPCRPVHVKNLPPFRRFFHRLSFSNATRLWFLHKNLSLLLLILASNLVAFICNLCTPWMKELVIVMDENGESGILADDNAVHVRMDAVDKCLGRTVFVLERENM